MSQGAESSVCDGAGVIENYGGDFESCPGCALCEVVPDPDVERARSIAVQLENQIAAATAIHAPLDLGVGTDNCRTVCTECGVSYPCKTAVALGASLLDDDQEGLSE